VSSFAGKSGVAAYHSVGVHGGVTGAAPHGLVLMLMNAAMERMAIARGCIDRGDIVRKSSVLHSCVTIMAELRGSLNLAEGGALAQNLDDLYDYMIRQLMLANARSDAGLVMEVSHLLDEIRGAWTAIGPEVRNAAAPAKAAGSVNAAAGVP
jgi:flagellar secretion chaperone FliS